MDQTLFHLINQQWTLPGLDVFMAAISNVEIWKPFIFLLVLYLLLGGGFKGRAFLFCALCAVLINSSLTNELKNLVQRRRPKQVERARLVDEAKARPEFLTLFRPVAIRYSDEKDHDKSGPSFPSGHVTNNVTIAVVLSFFFRRWGRLYFFPAALIAYSRIYLGAHWPSDVLATLFLALGETFLLLALFEFLWEKMGASWWPVFFARHPRLFGATTA